MTKNEILKKQWEESLGLFLHYIFHPDQYSEDDHEPSMVFMNILDYVFHEAIALAKIRDEWGVFHNIYTFGQAVSFKSKKFGLPFVFGTHLDKIYVRADVGFAKYLRYMKDDFWSLLSGLEGLGELTFDAYSEPKSDGRPGMDLLFKNKVSVVYIMMRNYVLLTQANGEQDDLNHFGKLQIEWSVSVGFDELLAKVSESVRRLHRLNYLLYRPYYQRQQKWLKETFLEFSPEQQSLYGGFEGFVSAMNNDSNY
jgi:hypothetical protein